MGHKNHHKKHSTVSSSFVPDYSSKMSSSVKKHHHKKHHYAKHSSTTTNTNASSTTCSSSTTHKHHKCGCEPKYYFPLPNLPTRPVSERVGPLDWLAPGSVQACCSICSTVRPVYANPCDPCVYDRKVCPINNTAYYNTGEYNI